MYSRSGDVDGDGGDKCDSKERSGNDADQQWRSWEIHVTESPFMFLR